MKCTLLIGIKQASFFNEDKKAKFFTGQFKNTNLICDSVDKAMLIAELTNLDCFRIMKLDDENEFSYSDTPIFETQNITNYYTKTKEKAIDHDKKQNAKVKAINAMPKRFPVSNFGLPDITITLVRHEYSYEKKYSRSIRGSVSIEIKYKEKVYAEDFDPSYYITKSGAVQLKKLKSNFKWEIGLDPNSLPSDFDFKGFLKSLKKAKANLTREIGAKPGSYSKT